MADAEDEGGFDDGRGEQDAQSDVPGAAAAGERGDENPKSDANGEAAVSELAQPASEELAGGPSPGTGLLQLLLGEEEQVGAGSHELLAARLSASSCFVK